MIVGFEKETAPLTKKEKDLIPFLTSLICKYNSREKCITNKNIREFCAGQVEDTRVRKIINYIRINNIIKGLIATSNGYYVSDNINEIKQYSESLRNRVLAIDAVKNCIDSYIKELEQ